MCVNCREKYQAVTLYMDTKMLATPTVLDSCCTMRFVHGLTSRDQFNRCMEAGGVDPFPALGIPPYSFESSWARATLPRFPLSIGPAPLKLPFILHHLLTPPYPSIAVNH